MGNREPWEVLEQWRGKIEAIFRMTLTSSINVGDGRKRLIGDQVEGSGYSGKNRSFGVCAVLIPAPSLTVSVFFMCKMRIILFIVCELELIYVFKTDCKYC